MIRSRWVSVVTKRKNTLKSLQPNNYKWAEKSESKTQGDQTGPEAMEESNDVLTKNSTSL